MADERTAYSDSSCRFEQLSCIKNFHPSYGLFYINFQSFITISEIILIRELNVKLLDVPNTVYTKNVH